MTTRSLVSIPTLGTADTERAVALLELIYDPSNHVGETRYQIPKTIPAGDIAWLREVGLDPNATYTFGHDEAVATLRAAAKRLSIQDGVAAFVASIDSDGPPHGCILEAALLAHRMPDHALAKGTWCRTCGLYPETTDLIGELFLQWHTQGSGIPGSLAWALLAIGRAEAKEKATPSAQAIAIVAHGLQVLDGLPPKAAPGAAFDALAALGVSKRAARSIVETLAFAGILEAPPHVGLATRFVSFADRDQRPTARTEFEAPLGFWRGEFGVNWTNAKELFGRERKLALPALASAEPPAKPAPKKRASKVTTAKAKPIARRPA